MSKYTPDRWDSRYDGSEYFYGTDPNDFLAESAEAIIGTTVLCIADGEGRNGVFLAGRALQVTSLDGSEVAGHKARALAKDHGVDMTVVTADLHDYDLGADRWDAVVSIFVHMAPEKRRALHRRIARALKPGGVVLLEAYTPDQLKYGTGGPSDPDFLMTLADLREDFAGLTVEVGRELVREIEEGTGHRGTSSVVQLVARKA